MSFLKAFRQRKRSLRNEHVEQVLRIIKHLMCIVWKMGSIGRSGNGRRWRTTWSLECKAGLMSMNQRWKSGKSCWQKIDEERKKNERLKQQKVWVEELLDSAEGGGGGGGMLHNYSKSRPWSMGR